jgi:hypothetical protein
MREAIEECVYCGERPATTRDHVIPKSIFSPPRPSNLITVPSCQPCNSDKQKYDDFLRDFLSIDDFTNHHAESLKLFQGPTGRAIDKNRSRLAKRIMEEGVVVEVRSPEGELLDWRYALRIEPSDLEPFFRYVAIGLSFDQYGIRLPKDVVIDVSHLPPEAFTTVTKSMAESGAAKGPVRLGGDTCVFMSLFGSDYNAAWAISFFQDRWFSVGVSHPDGDGDFD